MKRRIVISGVNLTMMGLRSVMQDCLSSLAGKWEEQYEIIALVHKAELFSAPHVRFHEFPDSKTSWGRRLYYEFIHFRRLSEQWNPYLWLSMHDVTPDVKAVRRAVYCHNPCPFYPFNFRDLLDDWKFAAFTLFYDKLYGVNIKKNDWVIVQHDWMRQEFKRRHGINNVVVAQPVIPASTLATIECRESQRFVFLYPSFPRVFKDFETLLQAVEILESESANGFEVRVTLDGTENSYARRIRRRFGHLSSVRFLGKLTREEVFAQYRQADCLVFPSRLETWGMPLSEFKQTGKPIIVSDLPYAHETVGDYGRAAFATPHDPGAFANVMRSAVIGDAPWMPHHGPAVAHPFCRNWDELFNLLLAPASANAIERQTLQENSIV